MTSSCIEIKSLRPSDQYMRQWSNDHWFRWRLGALSVPSHCLNQCWNIVHWTLGINFRGIFFIEINTFLVNKKYLKMSSAKWCLFRLGLNVSKRCTQDSVIINIASTRRDCCTWFGASRLIESIFHQDNTHRSGWAHSAYGLNQWQDAFLCNAFSHWPIPYTEWSLHWILFGLIGKLGHYWSK